MQYAHTPMCRLRWDPDNRGRPRPRLRQGRARGNNLAQSVEFSPGEMSVVTLMWGTMALETRDCTGRVTEGSAMAAVHCDAMGAGPSIPLVCCAPASETRRDDSISGVVYMNVCKNRET